jgi:hypothetical protein
MLYEFNNVDVEFGIAFSGDISGGGWSNDLEKIIKDKLNPEKFKKIIKEENWNYSEIDFIMSKDKLDFKLEINKADTISIILLSKPTESNKQKLREWTSIIETETQKLKS